MQQAYAASPYNMQQGAEDRHVEMSLREHLLAAQAGQQLQTTPPATHSMHTPSVGGSHDQRIDPAISGGGYHHAMASHDLGDSGGEGSPLDSRKGRRELSTSKRAAQNRAAQRAFRQRKEEYIKSLKDQVEDYKKLGDDYKAIQAENYQLREYVINLQQRLLESQGNYPEPPANIDLTTRERTEGVVGQPSIDSSVIDAAMTASAVDQLQAAAAQAAKEESGEAYQHDEGQYERPDSQDYHVLHDPLLHYGSPPVV